MSRHPHLHALLSPASVAVVGASSTPGKTGHTVLRNLLRSGFQGPVFPINPKGETILGLQALRKAAEIPADQLPLDLAVLCIPASAVVPALEDVAAAGVRAVIVVSSGFKENGAEGARLEAEVKNLAAQHGIALLGPGSIGLAAPHAELNLFAVPRSFAPGAIGFFSQSASICDGMSDWAERNGFGFSSFVSLGNKAMIDEADVISAMADDPHTKVILGFLENVENGARFLLAAQDATRKKPVILMKAARTHVGARAAGAHSGAAAGSDMAYEAAFKQAGIIRAEKTEDLFTLAQAFSSQPLPKGPGVGVVTTAGGPGIVAADACAGFGLTLPMLSPLTLSALKEVLPGFASAYNPVDIGGDASEELLMTVLGIVLKDPAVHSLLFVGARTQSAVLEKTARFLAEEAACVEKPVFACIMGGEEANETRRLFRDAGVACYDFPETAVRAASSMLRQSLWKDSPLPVEVGYRRDVGRARKVIGAALKEGITDLAEYRALELMRAYEMPVLETKLARTSDEAVSAAKQLGYPVALKIASPHITHKMDAGGVALDIASPEALRKAFADVTAKAMRYRKNAYIAGCLVQSMAPKNSHEVVIGFRRDMHFGPMVLFSLGGIYRETFQDVACRLAPLSLTDAHDMIREIRFFPLLASKAGAPKFTVLEDLLLIMSELAVDFPEIQEAECNPVFASEQGALVGGMRVYLRRS